MAAPSPRTTQPPSRRRDGHSAAPPSPCSRRFNRDGERASAKMTVSSAGASCAAERVAGGLEKCVDPICAEMQLVRHLSVVGAELTVNAGRRSDGRAATPRRATSANSRTCMYHSMYHMYVPQYRGAGGRRGSSSEGQHTREEDLTRAVRRTCTWVERPSCHGLCGRRAEGERKGSGRRVEGEWKGSGRGGEGQRKGQRQGQRRKTVLQRRKGSTSCR